MYQKATIFAMPVIIYHLILFLYQFIRYHNWVQIIRCILSVKKMDLKAGGLLRISPISSHTGTRHQILIIFIVKGMGEFSVQGPATLCVWLEISQRNSIYLREMIPHQCGHAAVHRVMLAPLLILRTPVFTNRVSIVNTLPLKTNGACCSNWTHFHRLGNWRVNAFSAY